MYTLTQKEFVASKSALTRAKNSGDPDKVLKTVTEAVRLFDSKGWPDNWPSWRIALEDAASTLRMSNIEGDFEKARQLEDTTYQLFNF